METQIQTYLEFGKSKLRDFQETALPRLDGLPSVTYDVTSGMQAGCHATVEALELSIAEDPNADLFLLEGKEPVSISCRLTVLGPMITVETLRSDVFVNRKTVVEKSPPIRLPCSITIGKTDIEATASHQLDVPNERSEGWMLGAAMALMVLLALMMAFYNSPKPPILFEPRASERSTAIPSIASAVERANEAIENAGLSGVVKVEVSGAQEAYVSGNISEDRQLVWAGVQERIDTELSKFTIITDLRRTPSLMNAPAISMAVLGDEPYIVTSLGQALSEGDSFVDDWTITAIDSTSLSVTRDGETLVVDYE